MDREAIEEAIEVLEDASAEMLTETGNENYYGEAITALRQALETEQEPVAWRYKYPDGVWQFSNGERVNGSDPIKSQPLYTAPPKKEWVGLTEEEIISIGNTANLKAKATSKGIIIHPEGIKKFYQTIEAKLKERNT
jgi:hypothetical protein